jgi:hypothetical protein
LCRPPVGKTPDACVDAGLAAGCHVGCHQGPAGQDWDRLAAAAADCRPFTRRPLRIRWSMVPAAVALTAGGLRCWPWLLSMATAAICDGPPRQGPPGLWCHWRTAERSLDARRCAPEDFMLGPRNELAATSMAAVAGRVATAARVAARGWYCPWSAAPWPGPAC